MHRYCFFSICRVGCPAKRIIFCGHCAQIIISETKLRKTYDISVKSEIHILIKTKPRITTDSKIKMSIGYLDYISISILIVRRIRFVGATSSYFGAEAASAAFLREAAHAVLCAVETPE